MSLTNDYFIKFRANVNGKVGVVIESIPQQRENVDYDGLNNSSLENGEVVRVSESLQEFRDSFRLRNEYPNPEFYSLGIVAAYIKIGSALPAFPGSIRSNPSKTVIVRKIISGGRPPIRDGDREFFPREVEGREWRECIVPILKDEMWNPQIPVNKELIRSDFYGYAFLLERALVLNYKELNYIP